MTTRTIRSILMDLDGTLVDSASDIAAAVNAMMRRLAWPECDEAVVRAWVGGGAVRLVQRALAVSGSEPDPEELKHAHSIFLAEYEQRVCDTSRLYPGAREALDALRRDHYRLACVTNKPVQLASKLLQELKIDHCFSVVVGGDSIPRQKPDPAVIRYAAERLQSPLEECLMVGDSLNDVESARAAGVRVVCVSYGYNQGKDIREARPDAVIDSLMELRAVLKTASDPTAPAADASN